MGTGPNVGWDYAFKAGADLSACQYHAVYMSANDTVKVYTSGLAYHVGILQNKPAAAGRGATVRIAGHSKVMAGGTLAIGQSISAAASGWIVATTSGLQGLGICIKSANSGYPGEALIFPTGHYAVTSAETNQG